MEDSNTIVEENEKDFSEFKVSLTVSPIAKIQIIASWIAKE